MVTKNDLPQKAIDAAERYKDNNSYQLCPAVIEYGHLPYYCFIYKGTANLLVLKEDGSVPFFNEHVKQVALIVKNWDASGNTLRHIGIRWADDASMKKMKMLKELLEKIDNELVKKNKLDISQQIQTFIQVPDEIIRNQKTIEQSVDKGIDLFDGGFERGRITEVDQQRLRRCIVDMARAAHQQNDIQFKTSEQRKNIIKQLSSLQFSSLKLFFSIRKLRSYNKKLFNKYDPAEMKETSEMIKEDEPLEEKPEGKEVIQKTLNPRN
ncbi:hypothetical protein [Lentibacillus salicampi]|uniref:Uncharacterized protein n=1 Tax=Lentibacillus salicampi TaxID=175306 RepID=A0A4Y9A6J6_9BACI|nr:hypothetical protein [Lentibacillus salicampi]TFJ91286.1 hypothetical protein E4U82_18510 [Lentibacillus salicampi]